MVISNYNLWDKVPGTTHTNSYITHYSPKEKSTDSAVLIIPGGGYDASPSKAPHEGDRVARHFCEAGINVFVLEYRFSPDNYPLPLFDGRRAMRYIRFYSEKFEIDKNKIIVMGYSAGGHLAASLAFYNDALEYENVDEIDKEKFSPDYLVLCYPVVGMDDSEEYTHVRTARALLGEQYEKLKVTMSFEKTNIKSLPPTFIFHNFDDGSISVVNSLKLAENIKKVGGSAEIHIFPDGGHGVGLPIDDRKDYNHNKKWIELLEMWFKYNNL